MRESLRNTILFLVFLFGLCYQIINREFNPNTSMAAAVAHASWISYLSFSRLKTQGKFLLLLVGLTIISYIVIIFFYTLFLHRSIFKIVDDEFILQSTNIAFFLIFTIGSIFLFEGYFKGHYSFGKTLESIGKFVCLISFIALSINGFLGFSKMYSNINEALSDNSHLINYIYTLLFGLLVIIFGWILNSVNKNEDYST